MSKTSIFELSKVKNGMSRLCTNPLGDPPGDPPPPPPKMKKKSKYALKHAYIAWMVILGDHGIIKISFENFDFLSYPTLAREGEKPKSRLSTNPLGDPPPPRPIPKWGEKQ